ncbi:MULTISPECIES: NADase-type glycan-binding domain-containing protein [unclassified Streptomyces]|uniref:NADase-type glycan-binding domain-containing protein n=1 Tax=unclassified Streptomyces TaxID=2593676 RepID=UPI00381BED00
MGAASSGHQGWHVPGEQDMCHGCGVVAYPGEMFCVSCGAYLGWDRTGSNPVVPSQPGAGAGGSDFDRPGAGGTGSGRPGAGSADFGRSAGAGGAGRGGGPGYGGADAGRTSTAGGSGPIGGSGFDTGASSAGGAGYGVTGTSPTSGPGYGTAGAAQANGSGYGGTGDAAARPTSGDRAGAEYTGARDWDIRALYPEAQQDPSGRTGYAGTGADGSASGHLTPGSTGAASSGTGPWTQAPSSGAPATGAWDPAGTGSPNSGLSSGNQDVGGLPEGLRAEPVRPQGLSSYPGRPAHDLYAAPPSAEDPPHRPQFATPAEAGLYAAADSPYTAPAQADPAAAQTQVIDGEVVLWATLPDEPADPSAADAATPSEGIPHLLLCPECQAPNAENRTYCHPCGALLRPEPEPPEPTRWERLRKEYLERPKVWHWDHRWSMALTALPVCLAAGMSMGGVAAAAERAVPLVKDRFATQYAVTPKSMSATSSAKGFDAQFAHDGVDNKAWAPQGTGDAAVGQAWTATFQSPFRLTALSLINGASKTPEQFFESGRPTKITVTATTTDQGPVEKQITLGGQPGPQRFDLGIDNVISVQVRIDAVAPALKPNMPVAMAEIQFFSRQTS